MTETQVFSPWSVEMFRTGRGGGKTALAARTVAEFGEAHPGSTIVVMCVSAMQFKYSFLPALFAELGDRLERQRDWVVTLKNGTEIHGCEVGHENLGALRPQLAIVDNADLMSLQSILMMERIIDPDHPADGGLRLTVTG